MTNIWNFILRHSVTIGLLIMSIILIPMAALFSPELKALTLAIAYEMLALFLCGIANFVYTNINFAKDQPNTLGYIFIGVHLLVAVSIGSTYWLEFLKKTVLP